MTVRGILAAVAASISITAIAQDQKIPPGFIVPKCTISPDGRYGVTVPITLGPAENDNPKNSVIELRTGRIVTPINTRWTGWTRMNHGGVLPSRWSKDADLLLWAVDGKWFPDAVILLKFNNGSLQWQTDITAKAEAEILKRTKTKAPGQYAKAKQANAGSGAAYPEGFSIYVKALNRISLPLKIDATLTSNPKEIEDMPTLESHLTGLIDADGALVVNSFEVTSGLWEKYVENGPGLEPCEIPDSGQDQIGGGSGD